MRTHYASPLAFELIRWAKEENSHAKALKLVDIADKVDTAWLRHADSDVARWRMTEFEKL